MIPLATLNSYASQFAGTQVSISCDAPSTFAPGVMGDVVYGADGRFLPIIHIPAATCNRLEHADTGNMIEPADWLIVAHEATHIETESGNECDVERQALKNEWGFVRLFKLAAWRTRAILAGAAYVDAHLLPIYHEGCTNA